MQKLLVLTLIIISGCAGQQSRTKSSVVDYLYPKYSEEIIQPSIPVLKVPIKMGIAFVPGQKPQSRMHNLWTGHTISNEALTEISKTQLLERIAANFKKYQFISEIEVIPSAYLTPGGSFSNLDQISTMYDIDVIALISYDQVQFTDEGFLSLTYLTLVGAYVISGEKNDTSTMIDTVVYDIKSRKMLFRAPGTSNVKGSSTPINLSEELRADGIQGFDQATDDMISNLDMQLSNFKEKIKKKPDQVKVVYSKGYSGTFGLVEMILILLVTLKLRAKNLFRKG